VHPPAVTDSDFVRLAASAATLFADGVEIVAPWDFDGFETWGRVLYDPVEKIEAGAKLYPRQWFESLPEAVHRLHWNSAGAMANTSAAMEARYQARIMWGGYLESLFEKTGHDSARQAARNEYRGVLRLAEQMKLPVDNWQQKMDKLEAATSKEAAAALVWPVGPLKPVLTHRPFTMTFANKPLVVPVLLSSMKEITAIRLHYRLADETGAFHVLEAPARMARFTIPAARLNRAGMLVYYFEVVHAAGSWMEPTFYSTKVEVEKPPVPPQ
jgi:hypothetical protein